MKSVYFPSHAFLCEPQRYSGLKIEQVSDYPFVHTQRLGKYERPSIISNSVSSGIVADVEGLVARSSGLGCEVHVVRLVVRGLAFGG